MIKITSTIKIKIKNLRCFVIYVCFTFIVLIVNKMQTVAVVNCAYKKLNISMMVVRRPPTFTLYRDIVMCTLNSDAVTIHSDIVTLYSDIVALNSDHRVTRHSLYSSI